MMQQDDATICRVSIFIPIPVFNSASVSVTVPAKKSSSPTLENPECQSDLSGQRCCVPIHAFKKRN